MLNWFAEIRRCDNAALRPAMYLLAVVWAFWILCFYALSGIIVSITSLFCE